MLFHVEQPKPPAAAETEKHDSAERGRLTKQKGEEICLGCIAAPWRAASLWLRERARALPRDTGTS
jgi:hypothetical protein